MQTRIERSSGGLMVLVPDAIAKRIGLREGESAELDVIENRLVVRPVGPTTLAELLAGITPENIHPEWDTGPPVGRELL